MFYIKIDSQRRRHCIKVMRTPNFVMKTNNNKCNVHPNPIDTQHDSTLVQIQHPVQTHRRFYKSKILSLPSLSKITSVKKKDNLPYILSFWFGLWRYRTLRRRVYTSYNTGECRMTGFRQRTVRGLDIRPLDLIRTDLTVLSFINTRLF